MAPGRTTRHRAARADDAGLAVYGANAVHELLRRGEPVIGVDLGRGARAAELTRLANARAIPVEHVERDVLDRLARTQSHQGVVALAPPFRFTPLEHLLAAEPASVLVLDGIQ